MRCLSQISVCLLLASATPAMADSHVFIIANQPDSYGIDRCLADGAKCGSYAALAYCQSRDFTKASAYRKVDREEVTGAVPASAEQCNRSGCAEYVAITCQR